MGELIWAGLVSVLENLLNGATATFSGTLVAGMSNAQRILDMPIVANTIALSQVVAGSLLGMRLAVEAWRIHVLHLSGEPGGDGGGLLRRTVLAATAIAAAPWVARTVFAWGNSLAQAIASLGTADMSASGTLEVLGGAVTGAPILMILSLIAIVLFIIILIQTAIRAVELAFLCAAGPIMAVGLTSPTEGVAGLWWRELIVISMSQAAQIFLLTGFMASVTTVAVDFDWMKPLFAIGWLWVAVKAPSVLRTMAYHTGVGGAAGSAAQSGGSMLLMRKIFTKG